MKYQIKGSTVTFTNQSVNIGDVTGWRWLLDSGSGFVEVANTLNADITFPATAGVTCTVKLLALGPWGATEVKYEEQFMTVENIPGPVINLITIATGVLSPVDVMLSLAEGTGAGSLTWELYGGVGTMFGLTVEPNGRLHGPVMTSDSTFSIQVKVTDQLGRADIAPVAFTVAAGAVEIHAVDMDNGGVVYDPVTMKVSALLNSSGVQSFVQPTAANQPIFIPDDGTGKACIEFSESIHGMHNVVSVAARVSRRAGFCGRVIAITSGGLFSVCGSNAYGTGYARDSISSALALSTLSAYTGSYSGGPSYWVPAASTKNFPFIANPDGFILTKHIRATTSPGYSATTGYVTRVNGVQVTPLANSGSWLGFAAAAATDVNLCLGGVASGTTVPVYTLTGKFRLYSFTMWATKTEAAEHPSVAAYDALTQSYAKKYNILCKPITSLTA